MSPRSTLKYGLEHVRELLGIPHRGQHGGEPWVASVGGLLGIAIVVAVTQAMLGTEAAVFVVPSLGAAAVIVFAAPHSQFAQPWPLLAGNMLSALVGVLCQLVIPEPTLAGAAAVGGAIGVMHLARCIHPPGGATALAAVVGGPAIHELGFAYALYPVGLNCLILAAAATLFNYPFPWRRYPASLTHYAPLPPGRAGAGSPRPSDDQVREAMDELNVVIDVSPEELRQVIHHAMSIAQRNADSLLPQVKAGHFYCNDRPGQQWSVRQIIDEHRSANPDQDVVIYRVVAGKGLNRTGSCTRLEFARWVGSEFRPRRKPS